MAELVTFPISYFEVEMEYTEPHMKLWLDRVNAVQAVYAALKPWNVTIDDVDIVTTGKPSEQGIKFKIPQKLSTFFFSASYCKFTRDSTNWAIAEETVRIIDAAVTALRSQIGGVIAKRKTVIVLHIQLKTTPFVQLVAPLMPKQLSALEDGPVKTMASIIVWDKRKITIDGSAQLANGIFLKYEREFDGSVPYADIAFQLKADEDQILTMLGVQEEI
jgi:hypothetical protein